jgi:hypothetical protein
MPALGWAGRACSMRAYLDKREAMRAAGIAAD